MECSQGVVYVDSASLDVVDEGQELSSRPFYNVPAALVGPLLNHDDGNNKYQVHRNNSANSLHLSLSLLFSLLYFVYFSANREKRKM